MFSRRQGGESYPLWPTAQGASHPNAAGDKRDAVAHNVVHARRARPRRGIEDETPVLARHGGDPMDPPRSAPSTCRGGARDSLAVGVTRSTPGAIADRNRPHLQTPRPR